MNQSRRNWTDFQDKAIVALVKKHGVKNWAEISELMTTKYGIENRTGKQCRERWHNHLDPEVNKNEWSHKEEKIMFQAHQRYGNKWTEIAKLFQGRTDNDIKNHFYSMLRRSLRRINKILGMRNSTQKIKVIKPSVLSKIFGNINQEGQKSQECKKIAEALFQFSKSKTIQDLPSNMKGDEKKRLQQLIEQLTIFNQQYEATQMSKKQSRRSSKNQDEAIAANEPIAVKKGSHMSSTGKIRQQDNSKDKENGIVKTEALEQEQQKIKKIQRRGRKKKVMFTKKEVQQRQQPIGSTRLKKIESQFSAFNVAEQFLPDMFELPSLHQMQKKSSVTELRKISSTRSGCSFYLNAPSPSMDVRMLTITPPVPTPNLSEVFTRHLASYDWKTNNEELDGIVSQTRMNIERNSKKK